MKIAAGYCHYSSTASSATTVESFLFSYNNNAAAAVVVVDERLWVRRRIQRAHQTSLLNDLMQECACLKQHNTIASTVAWRRW